MDLILLLGTPGGIEWVIILVIIIVLFGGNRIPQLAKGVGESIRNFKQGISEAETEAKDEKPIAKDQGKSA